jgi:hypothetical protein
MKHPGRTPAQRRVLDQIGCGNFSPIMANSTRDALLKAGLIVETESRTEPFGPFRVTIREFTMPLPVHYVWCQAMEAEYDAEHPR